MVVAMTALLTAGGVVLFLRSLPGPPRFDELRIEPGSTTVIPRGILRHLWFDDLARPVISADTDVSIDDWPTDSLARRAVRVVYRVPIERQETIFARFTVEGRSVSVRIRRGSTVVVEAGESGPFSVSSDSVVIPAGASDLEVELIPQGESPRVRVGWQEIDVDEGPRSLASLVSTERLTPRSPDGGD
jgi:hypothetical protein